MPALIPFSLGAVLILLMLAAVLWPIFRPRRNKKPIIQREYQRFTEEYSVELADPVKKQTLLEPVPELPQSYGLDRLVLMVRDPHWLYAYWEITATKMEEISVKLGPRSWDNSRPVLRVYDVTGVDFNGANAKRYFDCSLNEYSDNWYINVAEANRSYCVDLGRLFPDGSFVTILRSNIVTTPRDALSDRLDEEWMWIEGLYTRHQMGLSSPLIIGEISERMGKLPLEISSPGFNPGDH
ncbi:MAG: DUF4912 domain-containing protein [Bacillota bacterium]